MKTNEQSVGSGISPKLVLKKVFALICFFLAVFFSVASAQNVLTWDAGNTNNGAIIDPASGYWDVNSTNYTTNIVTTATTTATTNFSLGAGGIDWFQVNVPTNALAATNILLYATNLPVNIWFSTNSPQSTNGIGDALLLSGTTGGTSVLTTASVPAIVQGGTYYIGIDNAANANSVGYALQVQLSQTNAVTTTNQWLNWNNGSHNVSWTQTSTTVATNSAVFNGPDAPDGTYQVVVDNGQVALSNLTINASGYTFSGSPLLLMNATATLSATNLFVIADGKTVYFSNNIDGPNNASEFRLGSSGAPATVVFYGPLGIPSPATGMQPRITSTNGSILYLAGGGFDSGNFYIDADVRMTNGTYISTGGMAIARGQNGSQPLNRTGIFTLDGPNTIFDQNGDYLSVGRDTVFNATLNVQNGATLNVQVGAANNNPGIAIPRPDSQGANDQARMNVYGGTVNMGGQSIAAQPIFLSAGGSQVGQISVLNQTGGVINAWGGIQIGGSANTAVGGSAMVTNSGGFLYLGSTGGSAIRYSVIVPPTNNISLSGGTVGALQNWISSVPMTLASLNGNITFQCADSATTPWNISLSGSLTGSGGFNKTGVGVLTLTGTNNYSGLTAISNGVLVVSTVFSPTNGDVVVDGTLAAFSGLPIVTNLVANTGQTWTMNNLTFAAGTPTLTFNFGSLTPSTTVAPMQVNGNLNFTVTPGVSVDGSGIFVGTYPLIHYTSAYTGGPSSLALLYLPAGVTSAYVTNIIATKTIALVVTGSTVNPPLTWKAGSGQWDTTSLNWLQAGTPVAYVDNGTKDILFDDTATGTSPITVGLNTAINNPHSVTANNATKAYIISGTGSLNGLVGVTVSGAGSLTLATTNTYSGGTTVSSPGQLNINYGGNGGASSAIGTGALTLNTGAKIDNTSGQTVVLNTATPIPINWNDDWTFVGSTNLDLGLGNVTLGNIQVVLTVVSNTLTVNNQITDNGNNYSLVKRGNGALTLSNANYTFTGGVELDAGTLNINFDGALGTGPFSITGGTIDNTSGSSLTLDVNYALNLINWGGSFTFKGTTNLDLGQGLINVAATTLTVLSNTFTTEGDLDGHNSPGVTYNGPGTWNISGGVANNTLNLTINSGTVNFNKSIGQNAVNGNTTTVNTNGTLVMLNPVGTQMAATATLVLGGGKVDLNGDSESIATLTFNSGTLKTSAPNTASTLGASAGVNLVGSNCVFNVTTVDSSLLITNNVQGSGGLVKTGLGLLSITNTYTGNTTISNGTLVLNLPSLATNSTVTVNSGVLNLAFVNSETNVVAALALGGVSKAPGVYNATTDPLYISGLGSLKVVPLVPPINPLPGPIQFSVSGGTLALSWPTNLGWILQNQTNALNVGLTVNSNTWFDVSGSGSITSTNITIIPANPTVFFRLRHP